MSEGGDLGGRPRNPAGAWRRLISRALRPGVSRQ